MPSKSPAPPLARRLRPILLVVLVMLGLGVTTLEKARHDESFKAWGAVREYLDAFLNPIRDTTRNGIITLRRMGRMWSVEEENQQLRRALMELQLKHQLTEEQLGRLQRLSGLGEWSGPPELRFLPADVIGLLSNEEGAEFIVNRGEADGLRPRDPVVALGGLIGLVQSVDRHYAQVQGVSDPLSVVGAVSARQRSRGVVYGRGRGKPLEFVPENEVQSLEPGSLLLTSGFSNSIYPKGVVIGTIVDRGVNNFGLPYGIVQPAMPFEEVEEVLIILPRERPATEDLLDTRTLGQFQIAMPYQIQDLLDTATLQGVGLTTAGLAAATATLALAPPSTATLSTATLGAAATTHSTTATLRLSSATLPVNPRPSPAPTPRPRVEPDESSEDDEAAMEEANRSTVDQPSPAEEESEE